MGTRGRKSHLADPVHMGVRVERETRDNAKTLGLNISDIFREALEQAVEAEMREHNYQHAEEIRESALPSNWLSSLKWW